MFSPHKNLIRDRVMIVVTEKIDANQKEFEQEVVKLEDARDKKIDKAHDEHLVARECLIDRLVGNIVRLL